MKNHLKLVHPEFYSAIDGVSKNDKVTSPSSIASNSSTNSSSITLSLSDEKRRALKMKVKARGEVLKNTVRRKAQVLI